MHSLAPLFTGRASLSGGERGKGKGARKSLSPGWTARLWAWLGRLQHSSQALFSTAASGHKVQWGDFVISSQGSLKGPALLPEVNDYLLGHQQTQMSMCVGLSRRWGPRGGPGQG